MYNFQYEVINFNLQKKKRKKTKSLSIIYKILFIKFEID